MSGCAGSKKAEADDMLHELEAKVTAVVADTVATRSGLAVQVAAAAPAPAAGTGVVQVGLTELAVTTGFDPGQRTLAIGDGSTASRRVLPLRFGIRLDFTRRPADGTESAVGAARR